MKRTNSPKMIASQMLLSQSDCAVASVMVRGLPNTVLVQLVGTPLAIGARSHSLYAVYREGTMTFDAIHRFSIEDEDGDALDRTLEDYLASNDMKAKVLAPLVREVQGHFNR